MHSGHKLIELSDVESLKKENISIESSTKEFNEISEKIIELKNKIENEINKINNLYEKTIDDLRKSYLKKHEILLKEENNLKEKLQNEVTKVKEQLENYLSEANNEIKISERINKGIKKMENQEKNMIKVLSYISKINKSQKNMKKIFSQIMRNIKILYEEEKNEIKYEEYYFNGIFMPKNIEIKDLDSSSFKIFWEMDNIDLLNFDKNKFNYRIEMRKENENFEKIYEGNDTKYFVNNLDSNINYELRICTIYKGIMGKWAQILKVKTLPLGCDSVILKESKKEKELIAKINEWVAFKKLQLLYRGTRDGMSSKVFHFKCDNQGPTITLIKNDKGNIFGGYASISWTNDYNNTWHSAPESFLFTLKNIYNIEPTKFSSKNDQKEIKHYSISFGPAFGGGCDIGINGNILESGGWTHFPHTYIDSLGKGKTIFTGDFDNNKTNFRVKEIEVFKLFK